MKSFLIALFSALLLFLSHGCSSSDSEKNNADLAVKTNAIEEVASIKGQQLTGVTVTQNERIFVNFPRWRAGVTASVAEIVGENEFVPYPNPQWNSWKLNHPLSDSVFVAVQSVVAAQNKLYVVDTRNPLFEGVIDSPKIFVFNLNNNTLEKTYTLDSAAFHPDSYVNDVRIDTQKKYAYFTDSNHPGLIVLNLSTGVSKRVLDQHPSTKSEVDFLTINGKKWNNTVHSDGIALDQPNGILYFHALTGYHLYSVPTDSLTVGTKNGLENAVQRIAKTAAPDGMIFHNNHIYFADLENHQIRKINVSSLKDELVVEGDSVKWADTFSIFDGYLYYTNSRIHEAGNDVSNLVFSVNRVKI